MLNHLVHLRKPRIDPGPGFWCNWNGAKFNDSQAAKPLPPFPKTDRRASSSQSLYCCLIMPACRERFRGRKTDRAPASESRPLRHDPASASISTGAGHTLTWRGKRTGRAGRGGGQCYTRHTSSIGGPFRDLIAFRAAGTTRRPLANSLAPC